MGRVLTAALALGSALAIAQPAAAPSLALDYLAPLGCPGAASVFEEVKRLRGELASASPTFHVVASRPSA